MQVFGEPNLPGRYTANSYTLGQIGARATIDAARKLLVGKDGYVWDTHTHECKAEVLTRRFGLSASEWLDYERSTRPSDKSELRHLLNTVGALGIEDEWITHTIHHQAEC